jgi:CRP-like cAMP-binding protein
MDWQLLDVLSQEERRSVLAVARRRKFGRNDIIFHEGDPGDTLHLIDKGRVAIRVTTPLGDVATLLVVGPGHYFGEMAIVSPAPRNATAVALEPVETLSIHRDQLEELRERHRAVDKVMMEALITEVRRLSHQLLEALYVPVDKRVLRRLLDLVDIYDGAGIGRVTIPLTQEDLAQLAGTTRPTANKVLRSAEEAGALEIGRGRIDVIDPDALRRKAR